MIQRIQSIYLLIATVLSGGLIFPLNLWITEQGTEFYALDSLSSDHLVLASVFVLFMASSILTLITIFQFKKRQLQFVLGRLTILIN
ncbi:MAG: DUF4293 family protein, partial [Lutibacter sp.]|nr:DUF4293 family protein [Lutibacter sp.]